MTDDRIGYSYWNGAVADNKKVLWKHLLVQQDSRLCFLDKDGQPHLNKGAAMEKLKHANLIMHLFASLLHMTSGQPSRGTEIVDTKIQNSYRKRNLFKDHGDTWIIINYNKTTNTSQTDRFIPHLVYSRLADMLDYYLVVIRPFVEDLAGFVYGDEVRNIYKEYLFVDLNKKLESEDFSKSLGTVTEEFFGVCIILQAWRHISIAMKREYISAHYLGFRLDEIGDQQSGHDTSSARRLYAGDTSALPFLTTDALLEFRIFNIKFFDVLGVGPGSVPLPLMLKNSLTSSTTAVTTGSSVVPQVPVTMDQITGILSGLLANKFQEFEISLETKLNKVLEAGIAEALQIAGVDLQKRATPSETNSSAKQATPTNDAGWDDMYANASLDKMHEPTISQQPQDPVEDPVVYALQEIIPESLGKFKSNAQEDMVRHSYSGRDNLICIIGTGGGKTLSFEVPSKIEALSDKLTIVVVPFAALLLQLHQRAMEKNIPADIWDSKHLEKQYLNVSLLFVSIESSVSKEFET